MCMIFIEINIKKTIKGVNKFNSTPMIYVAPFSHYFVAVSHCVLRLFFVPRVVRSIEELEGEGKTAIFVIDMMETGASLRAEGTSLGGG